MGRASNNKKTTTRAARLAKRQAVRIPTEEEERRAAALHEAGHCIVALSAGVTIEEVLLDDAVIVPGRGAGNGFTIYAPPVWYREGFLRPPPGWPPRATLGPEEETYLFKRIGVALAGELVERRLREQGHPLTPIAEHERDDVGQASAWARYLADGDMTRAQAIMDQATYKADGILTHCWDAVERVAQVLLAKGRLTGPALLALLT
jgi:ATP-dependent Zn protease